MRAHHADDWEFFWRYCRHRQAQAIREERLRQAAGRLGLSRGAFVERAVQAAIVEVLGDAGDGEGAEAGIPLAGP